MITYQYICSACEYIHEVKQNPKKFRKLKKCPNCKENKLEQQYFSPHINFNPEITTVAQQAERNTKNMGKMELEDVRRKDKKSTMQMKFHKHVQAGKIDVDHADHLIEKSLNREPSPLDLDKKIKKKLSIGTEEEKQKKIDTYIKKGTV